MNIPLQIRKRFSERVFSCKRGTLIHEQLKRRRDLENQFKSIKDKPIEFSINDIHPSFIKERKLEKDCERFLIKIINYKCL
jgi:hypothetical protein